MRVFAIGAYGTNNVGDEAIFEGLSLRFPGCVPIHIGKSARPDAIFFEDVLHNPDFFRPGDTLIVGGGGLLYDQRPIRLFIDLAKAVQRAGGKLDILGLGCEAATESYYADIRELISYAETVEVRSSISQEILKTIIGRDVPVRDDFAFNLRSKVEPASGSGDELPHIGVITSGDYLENFTELCRIIKVYTATPRAKFHHIPHSRAFFDPRNNDLTVGQCLWSSIDIYFGKREQLFFTEPFSADPLEVLNRYRHLDGVISQRYHGLVFSKIVGIPHLVTNGASLKNRSFITDHSSDISRVSKTNSDLFETFSEFFEVVVEAKKRRAAATHSPNAAWTSLADLERELQQGTQFGELSESMAEIFGEVILQAAAANVEKDEKKKSEALRVLGSLPLPRFAQLSGILDRKAGSKAGNGETSKIIKALIPKLPFSEEWYLAKYPDIAKAVSRGAFPNPQAHFIEFGYFEGREGAPENPRTQLPEQ